MIEEQQENDVGRDPSGQALAVPVEPASGLAPSGFDPSRDDGGGLTCPHCKGELHVSAVAAVGKNQRLSYTLHPNHAGMIQAEVIGGQLTYLEEIFKAIAEQDGGKVRAYVERIGMTEDGGFKFDLAILDVRSWPPRDSDGSGEAGETGTGSTEGDSAGPKDIAQPPPGEPQ